jgi:hypothetical protein
MPSNQALDVLPIRHKSFTALIITFAGWNYSAVGCGRLNSPTKQGIWRSAQILAAALLVQGGAFRPTNQENRFFV